MDDKEEEGRGSQHRRVVNVSFTNSIKAAACAPWTLVAELTTWLKFLHELWKEWQFGSAGKKPAKDFTAIERGQVKSIYFF